MKLWPIKLYENEYPKHFLSQDSQEWGFTAETYNMEGF